MTAPADGAPRPLADPVDVPPQWRARGFSGRYAAVVTLPATVVNEYRVAVPCLLRDQAWLLLRVDEQPPRAVLVRLDAAALVDLSARRPSPGAYRAPPSG